MDITLEPSILALNWLYYNNQTASTFPDEYYYNYDKNVFRIFCEKPFSELFHFLSKTTIDYYGVQGLGSDSSVIILNNKKDLATLKLWFN